MISKSCHILCLFVLHILLPLVTMDVAHWPKEMINIFDKILHRPHNYNRKSEHNAGSRKYIESFKDEEVEHKTEYNLINMWDYAFQEPNEDRYVSDDVDLTNLWLETDDSKHLKDNKKGSHLKSGQQKNNIRKDPHIESLNYEVKTAVPQNRYGLYLNPKQKIRDQRLHNSYEHKYIEKLPPAKILHLKDAVKQERVEQREDDVLVRSRNKMIMRKLENEKEGINTQSRTSHTKLPSKIANTVESVSQHEQDYDSVEPLNKHEYRKEGHKYKPGYHRPKQSHTKEYNKVEQFYRHQYSRPEQLQTQEGESIDNTYTQDHNREEQPQIEEDDADQRELKSMNQVENTLEGRDSLLDPVNLSKTYDTQNTDLPESYTFKSPENGFEFVGVGATYSKNMKLNQKDSEGSPSLVTSKVNFEPKGISESKVYTLPKHKLIGGKTQRKLWSSNKPNEILSRIGPLDMWSQYNKNNVVAGKVSDSFLIDMWRKDSKVNSTKGIENQFRRRLDALENMYVTKLQDSVQMAHKNEDWEVANGLRLKVRVLCWVIVNHKKLFHAKHILATWGKRCTKLLFFANKRQSPVPLVRISTTASDSEWGMTKKAIRYLYDNHLQDADWFLRTDDVTYVILENLRYMLVEYNANEPLYFGCQYKMTSGVMGFMTDKAGYVLSRNAIERVAIDGLPSPLKCRPGDEGLADMELGLCLQHLSVKAIDTRDSLGRGRFFSYDPHNILFPDKKTKYWLSYLMHYPLDEGIDCCSDYAITFHDMDPEAMHVMEYFVYHLRPYGVKFENALEIASSRRRRVHVPKISTNPTQSLIDFLPWNRRKLDRSYADRSIADKLARNVRVLCWVMTCPDNHEKRAMHVKVTWGKRCNVLLFMSTQFDPILQTVVLPIKEDYVYLWGKTKAAFRYVHEHHREDADWFMKVDDDAYVVVENLRYLLSNHNTADSIYIGNKMYRTNFGKESFMSGGPGYVLSRAALDKFVTVGLSDPNLCSSADIGVEDLLMGECLGNISVEAVGSTRFLEVAAFWIGDSSRLNNGSAFSKREDFSAEERKKHKFKISRGDESWAFQEIQLWSKYAVSFHKVTPGQMYAMEYLIYHLQPYGFFWNGTEPEYNQNLRLKR